PSDRLPGRSAPTARAPGGSRLPAGFRATRLGQRSFVDQGLEPTPLLVRVLFGPTPNIFASKSAIPGKNEPLHLLAAVGDEAVYVLSEPGIAPDRRLSHLIFGRHLFRGRQLLVTVPRSSIRPSALTLPFQIQPAA